MNAEANPYKNLDAKYEALQGNLQRLVSVASESEYEEIGNRAQIALDKFKERVFRVAIVGEFSTGKSTLINAMLGRELLPTALEACTAVVTRIRVAQNGEETGVYVTFRMSGMRKIEPDELRDSLTFKGQEGDDLPVEAHVVLPAGTFLDNGIELIDTPGVNDPEAHGEQITLGFLPKADAIIFITHAARAFKESEVEFLQDRIGEQDRERVLFVVNACDILEEDADRDDLRSRGEQLLGESFGAPTIHLVSARDGLASKESNSTEDWNLSGMTAFTNHVDELLTRERGSQELQRGLVLASGLCSKLRRFVEEDIDDLRLDDEIRERRVTRIQETISFIESEEKTSLSYIGVQFSEFHNKLEETIDRELSGLGTQLSALESKQKEGNENDISGKAQQFVSACGKRALTRVQSTMRTDVNRIQTELAQQMTRSLGQADSQLSGVANQALVIASPGFDNLVTIHTDRSVQERDVVEQVETHVSGGSSGNNTVLNAGVYGLMAGLLIAPWAILPAFIITGGFNGGSDNTPQKRIKNVVKKVKDYFVTQTVDSSHAVSELRNRLMGSSQLATESIQQRTSSDVSGVYSAKIAGLKGRITDLQETTLDDAERGNRIARAEKLVKQIDAISMDSPTE